MKQISGYLNKAEDACYLVGFTNIDKSGSPKNLIIHYKINYEEGEEPFGL